MHVLGATALPKDDASPLLKPLNPRRQNRQLIPPQFQLLEVGQFADTGAKRNISITDGVARKNFQGNCQFKIMPGQLFARIEFVKQIFHSLLRLGAAIGNKNDFGDAPHLQAAAHLMADETSGGSQTFERLASGRFVAEDGDQDANVAQVGTQNHLGDRNRSDARVFQFAGDYFLHFAANLFSQPCCAPFRRGHGGELSDLVIE